MMEIIPNQSAQILAFRLSETLTHADLEWMAGTLQHRAEARQPIDLYIDITGLTDIQPGAFSADVDAQDALGAAMIGRCAIVGATRWHRGVAHSLRPLSRTAQVRCFLSERNEAAWGFLAEEASGPAADAGAAQEPDLTSIDDPEQVLKSSQLDNNEKSVLLEEMEYNEALRQIADDDGMQGGRPPNLRRVREAHQTLEAFGSHPRCDQRINVGSLKALVRVA